MPALTVANTPYVAQYGAAGLCEVLDPYIKATGFDINDFGEGLRRASSYDGKAGFFAFPYFHPNHVLQQRYGGSRKIKLPEKWSDMDEFMKKASKISGGVAQRYAAVIPGWDQWYFEPFYLNAGVKIIKDNNTTDLGEPTAVAITKA